MIEKLAHSHHCLVLARTAVIYLSECNEKLLKLAGHHSMINCFLRNLFNSMPSYFSHGLICPDTLVGD